MPFIFNDENWESLQQNQKKKEDTIIALKSSNHHRKGRDSI